MRKTLLQAVVVFTLGAMAFAQSLTAADREKLDDTYGEWLEGVTQRCEELQAEGYDIRRVNVDMSELAQWCRSRGVPLDGKSRAEFAAYKARGFTAGPNTGRRRE